MFKYFSLNSSQRERLVCVDEGTSPVLSRHTYDGVAIRIVADNYRINRNISRPGVYRSTADLDLAEGRLTIYAISQDRYIRRGATLAVIFFFRRNLDVYSGL